MILLGHSWGSLVGLAVAIQRPDLLHAYVGVGQSVDVREAERVGIAWTEAEARRRGDTEALRALASLRPYPDAGPFTIEKADAWRAHAIRYGSLAAYRSDARFYLRAPRISPDFTAEDIRAWHEGSAFTVRHLWPRMGGISFLNRNRLEVATIMMLGRHDITTPSTIVASWMDRLRAPRKNVVWFEHSAHLAFVEEPGRFFAALLQHVRPLAEEKSVPTGTKQHGRYSTRVNSLTDRDLARRPYRLADLTSPVVRARARRPGGDPDAI